MSPINLERAILAFCREAGLPRDHVKAVVLGNRVVLWVKGNPVALWPSFGRRPVHEVVSNA